MTEVTGGASFYACVFTCVVALAVFDPSVARKCCNGMLNHMSVCKAANHDGQINLVEGALQMLQWHCLPR